MTTSFSNPDIFFIGSVLTLNLPNAVPSALVRLDLEKTPSYQFNLGDNHTILFRPAPDAAPSVIATFSDKETAEVVLSEIVQTLTGQKQFAIPAAPERKWAVILKWCFLAAIPVLFTLLNINQSPVIFFLMGLLCAFVIYLLSFAMDRMIVAKRKHRWWTEKIIRWGFIFLSASFLCLFTVSYIQMKLMQSVESVLQKNMSAAPGQKTAAPEQQKAPAGESVPADNFLPDPASTPAPAPTPAPTEGQQ